MRVLVITPTPAIASSIDEALDDPTSTVDHQADAPRGLDAALENRYDVVVVDVSLPAMTGPRVRAELRAVGNWAPVLMVSETATDPEPTSAANHHPGGTQPTGVPSRAVVAELRHIAQQSDRRGRRELFADDLTIDPTDERCWRSDREILLTPLQFALIELLIRRAGHFVSRSEILETVWHGQDPHDPDVVDLYIEQLRNKIDIPFARQTIESLGRTGYRLNPAA